MRRNAEAEATSSEAKASSKIKRGRRGGARPGAGRPKKKLKAVGLPAVIALGPSQILWRAMYQLAAAGDWKAAASIATTLRRGSQQRPRVGLPGEKKFVGEEND